MSVSKAAIFCLLAYMITSTLLFGGPLQAVGLMTVWRDRLALPYWPAFLLVAMAIAVLCVALCARLGLPRVARPALFIVASMCLSVLLVGFYAESRREGLVARFDPDLEIRASIFESFRNAPRDFQFFLHGAALKECRPYAWSYRRMAYYELAPNVAVNVLPESWIKQCDIKRDSGGFPKQGN